MELNTIIQADALEVARSLPDGAADAIICDPPYATTQIQWDKLPMWDLLFPEFVRATKQRGAIILFGVARNMRDFTPLMWQKFRYDLIWVKTMPTQFLNAKTKPLQLHESIFVFSSATHINGANGSAHMNYYPQMTSGTPYTKKRQGKSKHYGKTARIDNTSNNGERYPNTILQYSNGHGGESLHPSQKPVALMEYLIKTYTQAGEIVFDPFMGSGTTAIAARNLGRNFIGCDLSAEYVALANRRLIETDPYQDTPLSNGMKQISMFKDES